jgi:hypothetical protein
VRKLVKGVFRSGVKREINQFIKDLKSLDFVIKAIILKQGDFLLLVSNHGVPSMVLVGC